MRLVYDFATTAPLDEIRFIEEARTYNMNAAREAIKGNYGHNLRCPHGWCHDSCYV